RLGVYAVGAADHGRVLELPRSALEDVGKPLQILRDDLRRLPDQQGLRSIHNIVRCEAVVKPAGMRYDNLGDCGGESDDVVANLGLNLVDAFDAKVGSLLDGLGSIFRNQAGGGKGFGSGNF